MKSPSIEILTNDLPLRLPHRQAAVPGENQKHANLFDESIAIAEQGMLMQIPREELFPENDLSAWSSIIKSTAIGSGEA
jgi:hypothetical protein